MLDARKFSGTCTDTVDSLEVKTSSGRNGELYNAFDWHEFPTCAVR